MQFLKKIKWAYYVATLALLVGVLLWGQSGLPAGGTHAYRLFSFYALIPGALFTIGGMLGYKNAHMKWLYPLIFGILTRVVVLQFHRLQVGLALMPFLVALAGVAVGVAVRLALQNMSFRMRQRLKKAALLATAAVCVTLLIHIVHALTLDRIIQYKEITFASPHVPAHMDGYRIAFIVDVHNLRGQNLMTVVDAINRRPVDLLLLGGDFYHKDGEPWQSMSILAQTITTDGIFGVEGNHDNYVNLFVAMEANGMVPLSNSGLHVRENFFLAGVEDFETRSPNIPEATTGAAPGDFVLLLSHNPDVAMQQDTTGVDLILSGHTHGGQITLFGLWAPYFTFTNAVTRYGQRFRSGWATSRDGTPVFVSNGVGDYLVRVFARPQVVLLTLTKE